MEVGLVDIAALGGNAGSGLTCREKVGGVVEPYQSGGTFGCDAELGPKAGPQALAGTGTSSTARRLGMLRSVMYALFRRSTFLIERYVMLRKPATKSFGTSTGRASVALIPLRIIFSERLSQRNGPKGGASRTRISNGCASSASGRGPELISASDLTRRGALFGKRGGDVAAAGVPDYGDETKAEVVEQRRYPARLVGHVV
jgi:hypothetical protein